MLPDRIRGRPSYSQLTFQFSDFPNFVNAFLMFREIVTGSVLDNNKALFAIMLEIEPGNCYTETEKDNCSQHKNRLAGFAIQRTNYT